MPLHPDIQALREHVRTMQPDVCCVKKPMRESNGKVIMCCDDACPWSKLDLLIANVSLNLKEEPEEAPKKESYTPVDRRWLLNTIGPLWLILALGTVGLFFIVEWVVYDIVDWLRERRSRRASV